MFTKFFFMLSLLIFVLLFAYQTIHRFLVNTATTVFFKIPGLSIILHHPKSRLYKIRVHGQIHTPSVRGGTFVCVMIDNQILILNKLYSNTVEHRNVQSLSGSNILGEFDWRGGVFVWIGASASMLSFSKSEFVYLLAGVHAIEVGVRTGNSMQIEGFDLSVEVIALAEGSRTNLHFLQSE